MSYSTGSYSELDSIVWKRMNHLEVRKPINDRGRGSGAGAGGGWDKLMLFVESVSQRSGNALYVWLLCSLLFTPSCSLALDNNPEPTWLSADGATARGACVDDTHYPQCSKTEGNALQGHETRACHPQAPWWMLNSLYGLEQTRMLKERNGTGEEGSRVKLSSLSLRHI